MIRTLTIVENVKEDGRIEYDVNGGLPLVDAAKALVLIAYTVKKPEEGTSSG